MCHLRLRCILQDPYFRFNDLLYEWISLDNWTYATTFAVSKELRSAEKSRLLWKRKKILEKKYIQDIKCKSTLLGNTNTAQYFEFIIQF